MTAISNVVNVTISKQTASVARSTFGVPAVFGQFLTSKTTVPFTRTRFYGSMTEAASDGWVSGDAVYDALSQVFGQAQKPKLVMVGRIDSADANISASLNAAQLETTNWYGFGLVGITSAKFTLSTALTASNVLSSNIDGTAIGNITYATSHAATMILWQTAIQSAIAGSVATISGNDMTVVCPGRDLSPATASVAGGTAVTVTVKYIADSTKTLGAASWTASAGTKLFGHADADATILAATTSDLPYQLKALTYDRTFSIYHALPHQYPQFAWMGLELSKNPGKSSWCHKALQGVTVDPLTEGETANAWAKNCSTFTSVGGNNVAMFGKLANGDPIQVTRNIDYAVSEISADQFSLDVNRDIIPYNDPGMALRDTVLRGTVARMETEGVFVPGQSTVTSQKFSEVSAADIAAQTMNLSFTSKIQMAIVKTNIAGVCTL
jgi:hypothetical protein